MHIETERKFLVLSDDYKAQAVASHSMRQGYIAHDKGRTVRVRISDGTGWLTIKGPSSNGISRLEWEKELPLKDAEDLFQLCHGGQIEKTRWIVPAQDESGKPSGRFFEVDEFFGDNAGLTVAEIELGSEDETFSRPGWLGAEVTGDRKYYNSALLSCPYSLWK